MRSAKKEKARDFGTDSVIFAVPDVKPNGKERIDIRQREMHEI